MLYGAKNMRELIVTWNNRFPLDYWYRKKYNLRFNSPEHRNVSFIDMHFDFLEERMMDQQIKDAEKQQQKLKEFKETGLFIQPEEVPDKESEELFNDIEI